MGTITLSWLIRNSRFGLQLLAIRDDEDRARGLGVRTMRVKLTAFAISGGIVGMIGGLWWFFIGQALPETAFNPLFDLSVALMAFLGGFGTLACLVLGALILEPLQQWIGITFTNGYTSDIVLGVALPGRHLVPAARDRPHRGRVRHPVARRAGPPAREAAGGSAPPGSPAASRTAAPATGSSGPGSTATGSPTTGTPSPGGAR